MRTLGFALVFFGMTLATLFAVDPARLATLHLDLPHYHDVHTHELKEWLDHGKTLVILDVRTNEFDDGKRLPKALFFPVDSSDAQISTILPNKGAEIVVYCTNNQCLASQSLAKRLISLGYTNVYRYTDGIEAWEKAGYPVEIAKK